MSGPNTHTYPPSWIPPSFAWFTDTGLFGVKVAISDPDVLEFIATAERWVDLHRTRAVAMTTALLRGQESLAGQIEIAAWTVLRHTDDWKNGYARAKLHCHGVFVLPGGLDLVILVAANRPASAGAWLSNQIREKARALLAEHQASVAKFDEVFAHRKQDNELLFGKASQGQNVADAMLAMESTHQRPVVRAVQLIPDLPSAAIFPVTKAPRVSAVERSAAKALVESGWPPSRDATYTGLLGFSVNGKRMGLVTWAPHDGLPSYPEVRWALQRRLPAALRNPRIEKIGKPKFDTGSRSLESSVQVQGFDPVSIDLKDALDDLQLDQSNFHNRVGEVRKDASEQGFEAIAWFQPYHVWTEETWGIYFDARKLDDLALSFLDDFKTARVHGSHSLAALLAFGLTYAHELFHARVEAALSWFEINALQPRHLRYTERVYKALRETPDWLEEALANWSAWSWFNTPEIQSLVARMASHPDGLDRIVEASLDLAPPGYKEWRLGHQPGTWRKFANQLSTGKPKISPAGLSLPLESTLTGPLPYDFQPSDIPLRFVGTGLIADRVLSHPATLNVISRRELQRALKHFRHVVDVSAGAGSHEKWTGPDNRAFPVPRTDPVSYTVFKSFLQYIGIDKATYVREVRPNL